MKPIAVLALLLSIIATASGIALDFDISNDSADYCAESFQSMDKVDTDDVIATSVDVRILQICWVAAGSAIFPAQKSFTIHSIIRAPPV